MMTRVFLIEDDEQTATEIVTGLRLRGFTIERTADGSTGLLRAGREAWDVLVVDRMLPGLDGLSIIEALRNQQNRTPALVLSALGGVDDRVRGLRSGSDDYVTKPFALAELAARIEALLRRPVDNRETVLRVGPLELDLVERMAWRGTRTLNLLPREFKLLEYLARREGQVVTRAMLLQDVWNYRFIPQTNLIDVHLGRLRRKVDLPEDTPIIINVRGVGYALNVAT
jgi:two-component system, OmpR family, response regulator